MCGLMVSFRCAGDIKSLYFDNTAIKVKWPCDEFQGKDQMEAKV